MSSLDRFKLEYRGLVETHVRPLRPEDGVTYSAIDEAEHRLGVKFPPLLREYYLLAGNLRQINHAQESLLPLAGPGATTGGAPDCSAVCLRGGHLVFVLENQGGCVWGVEVSQLGNQDPPVNVAGAADSAVESDYTEWSPFQQSLSGFLSAFFHHQASHCGLRFGAVFPLEEGLSARVERWPVVAVFGDAVGEVEDQELYRGGEQGILSLRDEKLWVAVRTEPQREAIRSELGADWILRFPEDFPPYFMARFSE